MKIITGDLVDILPSQFAFIDDCVSNDNDQVVLSCGQVDDLIISFAVYPIDGIGGTLAQAGSYSIRPSFMNRDKLLPLSGHMTFDQAGGLRQSGHLSCRWLRD
jgi:hypothetical protein